ncbi:MAG: hypothetical protein A3J74_03900 [Elusimicrobia bacterium RIFCSPHIGHO2_02_FULL_57_9]|nr:MAG: hypothetical protein A3J74_03900 [Elusimicrobia bacterium RIFCSPHIGHO2_02_FULL_57_9]
MKRFSLLVFAVLWIEGNLWAGELNLQQIFERKEGCFILYDLQSSTAVIKYNPGFCAQRHSPSSTFKIPIALMAFDQHMLGDENAVIKWDGIDRKVSRWNQDQTPVTWLRYSVVWVSRWITPQIGREQIKRYLSDFRYGNQDMSGGIDRAWLSSTLKISAEEQVEFLARFWRGKLGAAAQAIELTKKCLPYRKLESGSVLRGKTGSGFLGDGRKIGWFAGYLKKDGQQYVFVTNFSDAGRADDPKSGGERAKAMTELILSGLGL